MELPHLLLAEGEFAIVIALAIAIVFIAGMWKTFEKANQPGWAAIIPIYNYYILTKIVGREWWWLILMIIPYVGFIFAIIIMIDVAKAFGKGGGMAVALIFAVGWLILGFGDATYKGPVHNKA